MGTKNNSGKLRSTASVTLYVVAALLLIISIAFLVSNILFYRTSVNQYVSQGYTQAEVVAQLRPSQLYPAIFQSVIMIGISFLLWAAGLVNQKVAKILGAAIATDGAGEDQLIEDEVISEEPADLSSNYDEVDDEVVTEAPSEADAEEKKPQA